MGWECPECQSDHSVRVVEIQFVGRTLCRWRCCERNCDYERPLNHDELKEYEDGKKAAKKHIDSNLHTCPRCQSTTNTRHLGIVLCDNCGYTFYANAKQATMSVPVQQFNESGKKYLRKIIGATSDGEMDVYSPILTFDVRCPARQHAIKKLLCSGIRGKGGVLQDLREARDAIDRAIQLEEANQNEPNNN